MGSSLPPPNSNAPALALVVALSAERQALQQAIGARAASRRPRQAGFACFQGRLAGRTLFLLQAGIGADRARRALCMTARAVSLAGAWSLGFAGGLVPALRTGELVCPEGVLWGEHAAVAAAAPAQASVLEGLRAAGHPAHGGLLLTVPAPLLTATAKQKAAANTAAVAVDMEAAGVAAAAAELGIPWLALKVVLDQADRPLDGRLSRCTTPAGNPRWSGILMALATGGEMRRLLWRMRAATAFAAASLSRSLEPALLAWGRLDATRALQ